MKVVVHFFCNKDESDICFDKELDEAIDPISVGFKYMIQTTTERHHFIVVSADDFKHVLGMQYDDYVIHGPLDTEVECETPYSKVKLIDIIKSRKRLSIG